MIPDDDRVVRIGVGGPVGSGKTRLIERLLPLLQSAGFRTAVITNDIVTKADAERLQQTGLIAPELVVGVETGACPHTAIREDPSANIDASLSLVREHGPLDVILIESGGDNLAATFTTELNPAAFRMLIVCPAATLPWNTHVRWSWNDAARQWRARAGRRGSQSLASASPQWPCVTTL